MISAPQLPAPLDPGQAIAATRAALLRHGDVILPLAGAFVLLPQLAALLLGPPPPASIEAMQAEIAATPGPLLLATLVPAIIGLIADLAIAALVIADGDGRPVTPRAALATALAAWPRLLLSMLLLLSALLFVALLLAPLGLNVALLVLLPVALIAIARMLPLVPLAAAEPLPPAGALLRSWALGSGNGWALLAVGLAIRIVLFLVTMIASALGNGIAALFGAGSGLGHFVQLLLPALAGTAMAAVAAVLTAQIYLQLRGAR